MIKKITSLIILTFTTLCLSSFTIKEAKGLQKQKLRKIVVDAGHGGSDTGAHGRTSYEKNITLAIALKLRDELEKELPDVEVVMTRTTDVYDKVTIKANKANDSKADLFISIHCNDAGNGMRHSEVIGTKTETYTKGKGKKKKTYTRKVNQYRYWYTPNPAKGTETYIWAVRKTVDKVKALENHVEMLDSVSAAAINDFDPHDPQKAILYSLKTKQYFDRSATLAFTVEDEFVKAGRVSRGARQRNEKGIWVLQAVAMPAILVETGFISQPEEEAYLNSEEGQQETAEVITRAVKRYKYTLENKGIKQGSVNIDADSQQK